MAGGLRAWLGRLLGGAPAGGGGDGAGRLAPGARARWPHLRRGWLDPDVPLQGFRTTVLVADLDLVLGAAAAASGGRLGDAEVAEVADAFANLPPEDAPAFLFGGRGPGAVTQVWIALERRPPDSIRLALLADAALVGRLEARLAAGAFAGTARRAELERLGRFFVEALRWQAGEERPSAGAAPRGAVDRLERILADEGAPILELSRGLARRCRDLLGELLALPPGEVAALDRLLVERGAPDTGEVRRLVGGVPERR